MSRRRAFYFAARGWILALLFLCLVWYRVLSAAPLRWEMLALVAAGAGLRVWAGAHLGAHGNGSAAVAPALARSGPYAFSRNPLYLSNIVTGAGLVFFANALPPVDALLVLAFIVAHHVSLVLWEEKNLRALRSAEYAAYAQSVPRWLGLRKLSLPGGATETEKPAWRAVLRRQGRNLLYVLACVFILWKAAAFSAPPR